MKFFSFLWDLVVCLFIVGMPLVAAILIVGMPLWIHLLAAVLIKN